MDSVERVTYAYTWFTKMLLRRLKKKRIPFLIFCIPVLLLYVKYSDRTGKTQDKRRPIILSRNFDGVYKLGSNLSIIASYDATPRNHHFSPGEGGLGVQVPYFQKKTEEQGYKEHAFNKAASDMISVQRSLKNYRNHK